jgi:hypothetical protein
MLLPPCDARIPIFKPLCGITASLQSVRLDALAISVHIRAAMPNRRCMDIDFAHELLPIRNPLERIGSCFPAPPRITSVLARPGAARRRRHDVGPSVSWLWPIDKLGSSAGRGRMAVDEEGTHRLFGTPVSGRAPGALALTVLHARPAASSQRSWMTMAGSTSPAGVCNQESPPRLHWSAKLGRRLDGCRRRVAWPRFPTPTRKAKAAFFWTPATFGYPACQRTAHPPSTGSCGFLPRPAQSEWIAPVIAD